MSQLKEKFMTTTKLGRGSNYNTHKDEHLCLCILNVSQGPIVEVNQEVKKFWERIHHVFTTSRKMLLGERPPKSLETRWNFIKYEMKNFGAFFRGSHEIIENSLEDVSCNKLVVVVTCDY